jgi:uncharacterized protein YcaQ
LIVPERLSITEARRLALAAQGFADAPAASPPAADDIARVICRLGLLQLDFVNVLVPAHYLVVYSRLGAYDRQILDRLVYGNGMFTEQWAHEASIVPIEAWPLLRFRRDAFRPYPGSPISQYRKKIKYLSEVIEIINKKGAVTASDLPAVKGPKRKPGDWHRSVARSALEHHFGSGRLAVARRLPNFQRVYDLPERVIHSQHLNARLPKDAAQRELLSVAATAFGVATLHDLADYYRLPVPEVRQRLVELEELAVLRQISVDGWPAPAYVPAAAAIPSGIESCALLSPFDPLVWCRPRTERLFDFHYRIEIYLPEAKRKWGYYVLPFLLDDRIVARVDLKADRAAGRLLVLAAYAEAGIDESRTCERLAQELRRIAAWLGLESVRVSRRGKFARRLHAELHSTAT